MASNPEAFNETQGSTVVYREQGVEIRKQPLGEQGAVTYSRPEEKTMETDVEAQRGGNLYVQQTGAPAAPTITSTTTTTQTMARPSPARRTATTPAPRNDNEKTGFLSNFATKSTGSLFFALHAGVAFFSFLVFISAALAENNRLTDLAGVRPSNRFIEYILVVGQISFAVALAACIMERSRILESIPIRVAFSAFLMLWWVPALVIITFFSAFDSPLRFANGYFGAWGALALAVLAFAYEQHRYRTRDQPREDRISAAPKAASILLFFFSLMVMGEGIVLYSSGATQATGPNNLTLAPFTYTVFSIAFGAITAFLSMIMLFMLGTTVPAAMMSFGIFLWLWVAVSVLVLTFAQPYEFALGNGYYASLFCLLSSFGLLVALRNSKRTDNGGARIMETPQERSSRMFFFYMRVMTFASLVVLVAASLVCSRNGGCPSSMVRYEVAAGAVPLGLGLLVVLGEAFGLYKISALPKMAFALLMLLWWIAAFVVLTYFGTFITPVFASAYYANGFFFTWVALFAAALAFAETFKEHSLNSDPPNLAIPKFGFLLIVIIGSAIELGAGIQWYYRLPAVTSLVIYAIALGSVSIFMVLVMYVVLAGTRNNYEVHDSFHNFWMYLLTLWWAVGALVLTFDGLWVRALDNGYFSVLFTLGACLLALSGIWEDQDDDDDRSYQNAPATTTTGSPTTDVRTQGPQAGGAAVARY